MEKVSVKTKSKAYDILIQSGLFKKIPDLIKEKYSGKKIAVVSDSTVFPLYGKSLVDNLKGLDFQVTPVIFTAGEEQKNLSTLSSIYSALADAAFTRSDVIIAMGGGVTGDMAGLAAATLLRGTGFIQIPSTLLSMVDSSIGGKVAVDLPQGKNLVGAFYQPDAVYTDPALLETLTDRQFSDGMGELLKHGFIRDKALLHSLMEQSQTLGQDLRKHMDKTIAISCSIKQGVVEEDEYDNGIRQLLNFGHTIGHALERIQNYSGFTHGEAISVGMVAITRITETMGLTSIGETEKLIDALSRFNLPVSMPKINKEELLSSIRLDKKTRSGEITIAYIEKIGHGKLLKLGINELEDRINDIL